MERAEYEIIDDPCPYYAHVPGLKGVWATGKSFEECRKELISTIEGWIVLGLRLGHFKDNRLCLSVIQCHWQEFFSADELEEMRQPEHIGKRAKGNRW